VKRAIALVVLLGLSAVAPANATEVKRSDFPQLRGYICIDSKGIHRSWTAAFDGNTYCKLVPNPYSKARTVNG
jgi:hypothetical protein